MHEIEIKHDERFLARPWGVLCSCGFSGSWQTQVEAEQSKIWHEQFEQRQAELRQKGAK